MYETRDFKKGLKILIKGEPYSVLDFQHVKPGKGNQFTRTRLKNLLTGFNNDLTIRSGEKFGVPDIVYKEMTYIYKDSSGFQFMDKQSFETVTIDPKVIGDKKFYLVDSLEVTACIFNDKIISVDVAKSLTLIVQATEPGFKGNTVSNTTKPATMETGLSVQVPLHIKTGDKLKINTADGTYIEKVNKQFNASEIK